MSDRGDRATVRRSRDDDPIIEAPLGIVDYRLDVVLPKAGKNFFANVGPVVAIGVLEIPNIRRGRHENAALPATNPRGPRKAFRQKIALIENAVAIRIHQFAHAAGRCVGSVVFPSLMRGFVGVRIVDHFNDVSGTVLVVTPRHGARDQRFGGEQIHREARFRAQGGAHLRRGDRRKARQLFDRRFHRSQVKCRPKNEPRATPQTK